MNIVSGLIRYYGGSALFYTSASHNFISFEIVVGGSTVIITTRFYLTQQDGVCCEVYIMMDDILIYGNTPAEWTLLHTKMVLAQLEVFKLKLNITVGNNSSTIHDCPYVMLLIKFKKFLTLTLLIRLRFLC
jgi:hypothetical protein